MKPERSIDNFTISRRSPMPPRPAARVTSNVQQTKPPRRQPASRLSKPEHTVHKRHWIKPAVFTGIFLTIVTAAFVYQSVAELIIIVYGITAFVRRIPGRSTFLFALFILALAPLTGLAGYGNYTAAITSYAFMLFIVATACLARELSRRSGDYA